MISEPGAHPRPKRFLWPKAKLVFTPALHTEGMVESLIRAQDLRFELGEHEWVLFAVASHFKAFDFLALCGTVEDLDQHRDVAHRAQAILLGALPDAKMEDVA